MIIWVLALFLMALLGWIGFFRGAIRVAVSLLGILLGLALAIKIGPSLEPLALRVGITNPFVSPVIGLLVVFSLVSVGAKIGAAALHQKVFVWYQYKALDLQRLLWERLNSRLGFCLGLVNGALYFFLLMVPFQAAGYLVSQLDVGPRDPGGLRFLDRVTRQLETTGLNQGIAAWDPMPEYYYDLADVAGLIRHNPLLEGRLGRYPVFLSFAELPQFQDLASDTGFTEMRQRQEPLGELLRHDKVQVIVNDRALVDELKQVFKENSRDLLEYMETGKSAKYGDEPILGHWSFDLSAALAEIRRDNPNITSTKLKQMRLMLSLNQSFWRFVFTTNHRAILKGPMPTGPIDLTSPLPVNLNIQITRLSDGEWKFEGGQYLISFAGQLVSEQVRATIQGGRLRMTKDGQPLVFVKEE